MPDRRRGVALRHQRRHREHGLQLELLPVAFNRSRERGKQRQRALQMTNGFQVSRALQCMSRRLGEVTQRTRDVPSPLEMRRQLGDDVYSATGVRSLLALADPPVQAAQACRGQAALQRVSEPIPIGRASLRPAPMRRRVHDKMGGNQPLAARLDARQLDALDGRNQRRGELHPAHASRAEHLLLVRAEALDLPVEQMEQVGRNAGLAESIGEVPRHNPDHGLNTKPGLIVTSAGMGCRSENSAG